MFLLYPQAYRELYGYEMAGVFEQALDDRCTGGVLAYVGLLWCEFTGVLAAALAMRTGEFILRVRPFAFPSQRARPLRRSLSRCYSAIMASGNIGRSTRESRKLRRRQTLLLCHSF